MLNSIDLFSGCGGMTLGFKWAGFNSVLASDIDENCEKTFLANFPDVPFLCGDISIFEKKDFDVFLKNKEIDVIIGGPPCQGFSLANKNRNKVSEDPRNVLFYEFVKIINWYNPKSFVMENVKGLLSMQKGEVIKQIQKEFENAGVCGYEVRTKVLRASDYGVPQTRERVIIIGIRKDLNIIPEFPKKSCVKNVTVNEAISDLPIIHAGEGSDNMVYKTKPQNRFQEFVRSDSKKVKNHIAMKHTKRLIDRFNAIKPGNNLLHVWETHGAVRRGNPEEKSDIKFSQNNQRLFGDKPAPTIAASFQSNFIHPTLNRNFTAREGARLQSFPDDFIFMGMRTKMSWEKGLSQYQQIGNAVPPLMAFEIAKKIKDLLENGNSEIIVDENLQVALFNESREKYGN
ncbi:MAG TPA: DNA cytosine methyltransferase [Kaistella sp.]|nr:DNA cytosine methyltransferase [Kaistella sp.]HPZ24802.1 DNA cytosine methyltransferase [Kaistella sp.]HQD45647.1 DNA cytosine methyltransferase [Kaistella sp.]